MTEPYYGTRFKNEKIDQAVIDEWAKSLPKENENLGYSPENKFVADFPLISEKKELDEGLAPAKPKLIT